LRSRVKRAGFVLKRGRREVKWSRSDWAALIIIFITLASIIFIALGEDEAAEKLFIFLAGGGFGQLLQSFVER